MDYLVFYTMASVFTAVILALFFTSGFKYSLSGWDISLSIILSPLTVLVWIVLLIYGLLFAIRGYN